MEKGYDSFLFLPAIDLHDHMTSKCFLWSLISYLFFVLVYSGKNFYYIGDFSNRVFQGDGTKVFTFLPNSADTSHN